MPRTILYFVGCRAYRSLVVKDKIRWIQLQVYIHSQHVPDMHEIKQEPHPGKT
jgi:hypothetical protein